MFEDYIAGFSSYMVSDKGLMVNSVSAYLTDITRFEEFAGEQNLVDPVDVNSTHMIRYMLHLQRKGKSASTISRHLASLRCLFEFLLNRGFVTENPAINLKPPRKEKRIPVFLSEKEVVKLLELPDVSSERGSRDKAILELIYATGLRVTEMVSLNLEDLIPGMGSVSLWNRSIPIGGYAKESIGRYLSVYRQGHSGDDPLFTNSNGGRLTRQGLWKIIKRYAEQVSETGGITPQTIRNSFAVHMLSHGAEPGVVQKLLGHSDSASTIIFSQMTGIKDVSEAYKRAHPRA
jgi:integrase/recombinase XerD